MLGQLTFVRKPPGILFPVSAIKFDDGHVCQRLVQASNIDIDTIWIRTGRVKGFYTAGNAKAVLCNTTVISIGGYLPFTL